MSLEHFVRWQIIANLIQDFPLHSSFILVQEFETFMNRRIKSKCTIIWTLTEYELLKFLWTFIDSSSSLDLYLSLSHFSWFPWIVSHLRLPRCFIKRRSTIQGNEDGAVNSIWVHSWWRILSLFWHNRDIHSIDMMK